MEGLHPQMDRRGGLRFFRRLPRNALSHTAASSGLGIWSADLRLESNMRRRLEGLRDCYECTMTR